MSDIIERLQDQSLQLARRSFDSVDAGLAANVADAAIDEIERLRNVILIAEDVVWYDWSNNDDDAVHTMEQLRLALAALTLHDGGGK